MNILILTGRFGMGHLSAANSLKEEILYKNNCYNIEIIDIFDYILPEHAETIYSGFSFLAKSGSCFYNWFYNQSAQRASNVRPILCGYFLKRMDELVKKTKPAVIISTLPLTSQILARYKKRECASWALVTCITDISSHGEWINDGTDFYLVGSRSVKEQLLEKGVSPEAVSVTGIPVKQAFKGRDTMQNGDPAQRPGSDGIQSKERHLLIMGGGLGLLPESPLFYEKLDKMEKLRVTVITGRNQKLYETLEGKFETVEVIGFTDQVAEFMRKADFIATKPGGITLFEVINSGKPMLLFRPKLQQEKNNLEFAVSSGIGRELPEDERGWVRKIAEVLEDEELLGRLQENVESIKQSWEADALGEILKCAEIAYIGNHKQLNCTQPKQYEHHKHCDKTGNPESTETGRGKSRIERKGKERGLMA